MWQPRHPGIAKLGMSMGGSAIAAGVSWGGYYLWGWASKGITPDSWDEPLEITGRAGLYALGYGLLIPAGASTGVTSVGLLVGEKKPSWGALIGGYVGSAASVPFTVMFLGEPTWAKAGLAAGSVLLFPPLGAWVGYHLTPEYEPYDASRLDSRLQLYAGIDGKKVSAGVRIRF